MGLAITTKQSVNAIIKKVVDIDTFIAPVGTYAQIRLWTEGNPPIPSNVYVFAGEFPPLAIDQPKQKDIITMDKAIAKAISHLNFDDYGYAKRKGLIVQVGVPKVVVDGY